MAQLGEPILRSEVIGYTGQKWTVGPRRPRWKRRELVIDVHEMFTVNMEIFAAFEAVHVQHLRRRPGRTGWIRYWGRRRRPSPL